MVTSKKRVVSILMVICMLACVLSISAVDNAYAASKITYKMPTITLKKGQTRTLKFVVDGKKIKASKIKFKSSNKKIATVSKKGKIKARKAGKAKITASFNNTIYKIPVKVKRTKTKATTKTKTKIEKFHELIKKKGYKNSSGNKTLHVKIDSNCDVYFINHADSIEFVCKYYNQRQVEVRMTVDIPRCVTITPKVKNEGSTTSTTWLTADYDESTDLPFPTNASDYDLARAQRNLANSSFRVAMAAWQLGLDKYGYNLRNMGFTSY